VYAWYNGGTIYYYSDAEIIDMNISSSYMFAGLKNLESVDFSGVDTSIVKDMQYMFVSCSSLT
jgi:surface protein